MLSEVSVDKVFMHYFEQMLSASGGSAPGPRWETSVFQIPSLLTPRKKSCGRPCTESSFTVATEKRLQPNIRVFFSNLTRNFIAHQKWSLWGTVNGGPTTTGVSVQNDSTAIASMNTPVALNSRSPRVSSWECCTARTPCEHVLDGIPRDFSEGSEGWKLRDSWLAPPVRSLKSGMCRILRAYKPHRHDKAVPHR